MKISGLGLVSVLLFSVLAIGMPKAEATVFNCASTIDGAQANAGAGSGSPGTGSATMTYNDVSGAFSWNIAWSGLTGQETVMHFHGPALPNQNAGVQVDFGAISGISSPSIGNAIISAGQGSDLLSNLWYINIHTDRFPAGEIRGQVLCTSMVGGEMIPVDATSLLLAGVEANAFWLIPILFSGIGLAFVIIRRA